MRRAVAVLLRLCAVVAAPDAARAQDYNLAFGTAEGREPEARAVRGPQTVYQRGVPHTDKHGRVRSVRDSASFFPICLYHAIAGSFRTIKDAGFNCVHAWEGHALDDVIAELRAADLQLFKHWPTDDEVRRYAADPHVLGWYLNEEPTDYWRLGRGHMEEEYRKFVTRRAQIRAIDPVHPVFPLDSPSILPPAGEWWVRWSVAGDVSAHDNYALWDDTDHLDGPTGIPATVSLAVNLNRERKPVWLTVQAFEMEIGGRRVVMPTGRELRAMVFAGLIHGATGVTVFALDSWVTRRGRVIGVAPDTRADAGAGIRATADQVRRSRELWAGIRTLNRELSRLAPTILSRTSAERYVVYFSGRSATANPIRAMLKEENGVYTLLAVNLERAALTARFEFSRAPALVRRLDAVGAATPIAPAGNSFADRFGGFGAAVYQFRLR
jgi:hypothetical protein